MHKAVVSLATGLEDPDKVTVAFLVAVGAAEQGRPTLMFLTKEAVRLAVHGVAVEWPTWAVRPCSAWSTGTPRRVAGSWSVRSVSTPDNWTRAPLLGSAEIGGTVPMWQWIGDEPAVTFSY